MYIYILCMSSILSILFMSCIKFPALFGKGTQVRISIILLILNILAEALNINNKLNEILQTNMLFILFILAKALEIQ